MIRKYLLLAFALLSSVQGYSQGLLNSNIHGNFEFNGQYYLEDSLIGAPDVPEKFLNNSFLNLNYEYQDFSAGLRYENYRNPLLGFERDYTGSGITYRFVNYKKDGIDVTVGNFYDQFGSGLVFRSYEERGLGLDNAMEGVRVKYTPVAGLSIKGIVGVQRNFFTLGRGIVRGLDADWNLNETISKLKEKKTKFILGGSFVSKYEVDDNSDYILPENVAAGAGRLNIISGNWNFGGEYAFKANDPSYTNSSIYSQGYIYKTGSAALLTATYSKPGFGLNLGLKRIDNMSFRSERDAALNSLMINYLPAMTKQHTNILAAFYPYATQPNGEVGFQGEFFFHIKEGKFLGGSRGADVTVNYSRAQSIDRKPTVDLTEGYTSEFFAIGDEVYFEDVNVEYNTKIKKNLRMILSYVYINYNESVITGVTGKGHVYAHVGIAEFNWKIDAKHNLRTEFQHLLTDQDKKNWALLLAEYSISPHWFFAGFSEYNYGNSDKDNRINYYNASVGYTNKANRISLGYGRQRAGIFCVGGVCRTVPASNGLSISITSSF
ncbi:MAG: hypothetical protein KA430_06825 [Bacteroidia bacterium]|nr:hypothetical protein [Bacteroidia bacterium]